jgi:hypothetical protein
VIVVAGELTLAVRQGVALSVALSPLLLIYRTSEPRGAGLSQTTAAAPAMLLPAARCQASAGARQALECSHRGWGVSVIIGVAGALG